MTLTILVLVCATGVLVGLWRTDGGTASKLTVSLLWPIGPLAFAVTIAILVAASAIAYPVFGAVLAAIVLGWWTLG